MLKILICGSLGFGGMDKIKKLQTELREKKFNVIDQFNDNNMDYTHIKDFRELKDLSQKIIDHDLKWVKKCDIIISIVEKPSFGTAIEMYEGLKHNKKVILFAEDELPTPWPVVFSNQIAKSFNELLDILEFINNSDDI